MFQKKGCIGIFIACAKSRRTMKVFSFLFEKKDYIIRKLIDCEINGLKKIFIQKFVILSWKHVLTNIKITHIRHVMTVSYPNSLIRNFKSRWNTAFVKANTK